MDQYIRLEFLHGKAANEIKLYRTGMVRAKENERLIHEGNKVLRAKYESNLDLYTSLAQRSMESYNTIMDEIETIHASNFTV